jgi:hypothetical protein
MTADTLQRFVADDDALANAVMAKLPAVVVPIRNCASARKPRSSSRRPPSDDCLMIREASSRSFESMID